ncbi:unnamed protein product [Rotaria sp. Silwood1]|nr:unnamed protein product [Rotaria sp. Silwood1]CAF1665020.1 unnamed protein product [Rotaria sp. Silwood1]
MAEAIVNNNALNDLKKPLNEIKNLLKSINLNDVLKDKINLILDNIDSCFLHLSYDMKKMNNEIQLLNNKNDRLQEEIFDVNSIFLDRYFDIQQDPNYMIGGPFRMSIVEKYKEMGTIIPGKIESGRVRVGDRCVIMPNRTRVEVTNIYSGGREINCCIYGENIRLKLKNVEEEEISLGFILCDAQQKCHVGRVFDAQVELTEHKSNIRPGYLAVLHIHVAVAEVQLKELTALIDRKTGETTREYPKLLKQNQIATARFELLQRGQTICMELFEHFPRLGRFALLDEDRIVVVGKVLQIVE